MNTASPVGEGAPHSSDYSQSSAMITPAISHSVIFARSISGATFCIKKQQR